MKPYVYKITSKDNQYYYGVRWNYKSSPQEDLWNEYFTSSTLIHELIHKHGKDYFKPEILHYFTSKEDALNKEIELIRSSINDERCLNRACGKCTIWDDNLKRRMTENIKKYYRENEDVRKKIGDSKRGNKNPNFGLPPWRNGMTNRKSWLKAKEIYDDYVVENWNLNKRKYGRVFLIKRYNIACGSARKMLDMFKNGWNPHRDKDYQNYFENS